MLGGTIAHGRQQHGRSWRSFCGNGLLSCPGCGGRLGGWGHAVRRRVFTAGRVPVIGAAAAGAVLLRAGSTHVLLPAWLLARRCDGTAVIGDMLARAARGQGFRSIAAASGVPEDTVRGRLRRFRVLGGAGAGVLHPAGRASWRWTRCRWTRRAAPLGDAVVAVAAAAAAAAGRWPALTVSGWELAAVVTMGSLLSPVVAFRPGSRGCAAVCPGVTVQREFPSAPAA